MRAHKDWLDLLRLVFATLVLLAHSYWLIDYGHQRDPLRQLFGTVDCGVFAVCGFFILSGYLISSAWDRRPDLAIYLRNRALRIVPGFVVAFLVSVLIAGALVAPDPAAYYGALDWRRLAFDLATLGQPYARYSIAADLPLNGPMWTLRLELICYLITPLVLARGKLIYALWIACAVLAALNTTTDTAMAVSLPRCLLMFLSGAICWRLKPTPSRTLLAACAVALPVSLFYPMTWALGLATFGALLLLTLGRKPSPVRLPDISYGTYLYGWPVQVLLVACGLTDPRLLFPASVAITGLFGAASWFGIERVALRLKPAAPAPRLAAGMP